MKERKFKCEYCGIEFTEKDFNSSCGLEIVVCCPNECIIGTVYLPDFCNVEEIK